MSFDKYIEQPDFVGLLQFETGTACDGKCTFCPHPTLKRKGTATWSTLLEVIDTCAPYASTACPFLMGEPLIEPRLLAILDNLKQVNPKIQTHLYTNFHSMTRQKARSLIESQLVDLISVSYYGPTPELYAKYQPGFSFNRVRSNLKHFMQIRNRLGYTKPTVKMHYIALPDLLREYPEHEKMWRGIVDDVGVTVYRTHTESERVWSEQWQQLIHGKPAPVRVPCNRIFSGFYVLCNGDVVPCSADCEGDNVLGNIHECYHPVDIWWGEKAKAFRQLHVDRRQSEIPMCRDCNHWKYELPKEWVKYWMERYGYVIKPLQLATSRTC